MTTSTRNEPNDGDGPRLASRNAAVQGKVKSVIRCRLCGESIVLESNFRPTPTVCPHCGRNFVFDPQEEPLPVHGIRLRWSEVVEAQRRGSAPSTGRYSPEIPPESSTVSTTHHRRHDAHFSAPAIVSPPRTNVLAWVTAAVLVLAGFAAIFGWVHR
jgi:hypothetical protein